MKDRKESAMARRTPDAAASAPTAAGPPAMPGRPVVLPQEAE